MSYMFAKTKHFNSDISN
ncbi:hypothetical protein JIY74_25110 [Vibrio harveyi]|nr:hypothetical protein [Vibrio harveyi]